MLILPLSITLSIVSYMETIRTICCKINLTSEQALEIDDTLRAFASACNYIGDVVRILGNTNKVQIQKVCYRDVRNRFGLSANLAIRAIARVCSALKVPEKARSVFAPTSVDYDIRIFSFRERDWTFSLTLLYGRQRFTASLGDFQYRALKGQHPTSATLVKRHNGQYFLHVQVKGKAPEPFAPQDMLGVDLGIVNLAVDSDGELYSGKPVEDVRRKHNLQRKRLQRRNTKGARKKLKRIAGKEARFRRHENHVISKRIVETAERTRRGIALENLKGIHKTITARGGDARNRLSGWGFYQLRSFIDYKALRMGVPIVAVDPRNTSRTCSQCGHCEQKNRKSQSGFRCLHCGFSYNADWNAALNIRALGNRNVSIELAGSI